MTSIIQKLLENIFSWIWDWIIGPFTGLDTFGELIYGTEGETLVYGVFTVDEINKIYVPGATAMFYFVGFALLIGIIMAGMKVSSTGINPSNRTYVIEFFKDLLIVGIILFNLEHIYQILFSINNAIVGVFTPENADIIGSLGDIFENIKNNGILGGLIISLFMLGLTIWVNFYYMMRKMTLLIFMILGPLMVTLYLIPQTKQITSAWFRELVGTLFVQSVHAACYWMITLMSDGTSVVANLLIHLVFIPLTESLRSLLGLGGGMNDRISKAGAFMGLAGLSAVSGAVKGALDGKSVRETLKAGWDRFQNYRSKNKDNNNADNEGDVSTLSTLNNAGTDTGATPTADRMLTAGEILSKGGKALYGAAGAIAGMPLGPIGSIALATAGSQLGGVAGGVAGRLGGALVDATGKTGEHLKKAFKLGKQEYEDLLNAENLSDEELAEQMADKWTTDWADQNKKDFDERWSDLSDEDKEKQWQNVLASKRAQNLKKARKLIGDIKHGKGDYANAGELIDSTVDNLTTAWAEENKDKFMNEYDEKNPLSPNATEEEIRQHRTNREEAWQKALNNKRSAIRDAAIRATGVKPNTTDLNNTPIKVANFAKNLGEELQSQLGFDSEKIQQSINQLHSSGRSTFANAKSLVDTTIDKLTNDWAENNKAKFMEDYDKSHSIPTNAKERTQYFEQREQAWQKAVQAKRQEISNVVRETANEISYQSGLENSYVSKEVFAKQVGTNVADIIGKNGNEATQMVENATSSVKNASIYSGRTLNREFMTNRIAALKTEEAKENFVNNMVSSGEFATAQEAASYFDKHEAPKVFEQQLSRAQQEILPNTVELSREVPNTPVSKGTAFLSGAFTGLVAATGIPQLRESITPLAVGFKSDPSAGIKEKISNAFKAYASVNPIQKQANFRNKLSYVGGLIGGVRGYNAMAKFSAGGKNWENADGSFAFKWNPFNNAANQQIAEISEIEQMVQKEAIYDSEGEVIGYEIPDGAIRMATNRNETIIQVRDKGGEYRTVSRLGSGDSSLRKGNTIYQNLTIKDRQFIPTSSVYREDSAGGRIALNRTINVDPNKLVANRTSRSQAQIAMQVPPAYSQFVDSNEYYIDQIIQDGMENITMVVDRNRSYLVGSKDGIVYRISGYGPGDTRLQENQVVYRYCETKNKKLVVSETFTKYGNDSALEIYNQYTSTQKPSDLLPRKINRRNQQRQELDKFRNRALTEPLR